MKHKSTVRLLGLAALVMILSIAQDSQAALNAYLKLKSTSGGKTYSCKLDQSGKISFESVAPGTYDLVLVLDGSRSQDDGTIQSIEISSFSWGASNTAGKQGKSTPVTRSNISNNRTATVDAAPPSVSCNGVRVATGDLDGDGTADMISSPVVWSPKSNHIIGPEIVLHDITITQSSVQVEGTCKASWNLKENVK